MCAVAQTVCHRDQFAHVHRSYCLTPECMCVFIQLSGFQTSFFLEYVRCICVTFRQDLHALFICNISTQILDLWPLSSCTEARIKGTLQQKYIF